MAEDGLSFCDMSLRGQVVAIEPPAGPAKTLLRVACRNRRGDLLERKVGVIYTVRCEVGDTVQAEGTMTRLGSLWIDHEFGAIAVIPGAQAGAPSPPDKPDHDTTEASLAPIAASQPSMAPNEHPSSAGTVPPRTDQAARREPANPPLPAHASVPARRGIFGRPAEAAAKPSPALAKSDIQAAAPGAPSSENQATARPRPARADDDAHRPVAATVPVSPLPSPPAAPRPAASDREIAETHWDGERLVPYTGPRRDNIRLEDIPWS